MHVVIGTPTRGTLRFETADWRDQEGATLAAAGHIVELASVPWNFDVDLTRNRIVEEFLRGQAQWLFWLDDDCVPPAGAVARLIGHGKDIVGAPAPTMFGMEWLLCAFERGENGKYRAINDLESRGLARVEAVGCQGMLIRRRVLEAVKPPWFRRLIKGGKVVKSEDFFFCEKAAAAGFEVWADGGCLSEHYKVVPLMALIRAGKGASLQLAEGVVP